MDGQAHLFSRTCVRKLPARRRPGVQIVPLPMRRRGIGSAGHFSKLRETGRLLVREPRSAPPRCPAPACVPMRSTQLRSPLVASQDRSMNGCRFSQRDRDGRVSRGRVPTRTVRGWGSSRGAREARTRLIEVIRPHFADRSFVAEVPGDDVPRDYFATTIDAGLSIEIPRVLGRPVIVVRADEAGAVSDVRAAPGFSKRNKIGASTPASVGSNQGTES
jgi:hypothetical protein